MAKLSIEIPDEVRSAIRLPHSEIETELRKELAIALYRRGLLSVAKACKLAEMERWSFELLLGERRIERHYSERELSEDISYANSSQ